MRRSINYQDAIAVTRDIFWIGFYDEVTKFHCNPYMLIDDDDVVLIDPGSIPDFPEIMRKVIDVVNPHDINYLIAHHQDPDVCGNLAVTEDVIARDDLKIIAHNTTVRLIRHLGLTSEFYCVDEHDHKLTLKSGRVLEFMYTPFLHSPGAIVTYDTKTKTLFSSDIFGGVSEHWELFANGWDYLGAMKNFHEVYMPSHAILKAALERMQQRWDIERILPQHGCVLEGDSIKAAFDFLKELPCGVDLMQS
ncbi:MAG: MBL fold metallo-hydrolase [Mariprofundaceae bacterium]